MTRSAPRTLLLVALKWQYPMVAGAKPANALQPAPGASVAGLAGQSVPALMLLPSVKFWTVAETPMGLVPTLTMLHTMMLPLPVWDAAAGVKSSTACAAGLMAANNVAAARIL